jgi:(2Fe-2S) ferredoxin
MRDGHTLISMNFCSEYSRDAGEQLCGTVKPVMAWLLIEHRGRWEKNAVESLPDEARAALGSLPVRVALVKQDARATGPLRGFLALSSEERPRLFEFPFDRHEELADWGLERMMAGGAVERELFLVCTHGVHDRCCAKFGTALYREMKRVAGGDAWQVSHVGGCRFAPNVLVLPAGMVYGRVTAEDCAALVSGRVKTELLRGRSCYDKPVQAAEYFLGAGENARLERVEALEDGWRILFRSGDRTAGVSLVREDTGVFTYKSCAATVCLPRPQFKRLG